MKQANMYRCLFDPKKGLPDYVTDEATGIQYEVYHPMWLQGTHIDEKIFAMEQKQKYDLIFDGRDFYSFDGYVSPDSINQLVYIIISRYFRTDVAARVERIVRAMKLALYEDKLPISPTRISFSNCDFDLEAGMETDYEGPRVHRLPVKFAYVNPEPSLWLSFLNELMEPDDILTLQEFMGYCLVPTNKAQRMLLIVGEGGEGKSVIGGVMSHIFGKSLCRTKISALTEDVFALSSLENKLVMVDDDMSTNALKSTDLLKEVITCQGKMEMNVKHQNRREGNMYCRLMAFSNCPLSALYDRSEGFYRRQLIIQVKPRPKDRVDDCRLLEKLLTEESGIVSWMLSGLHRLWEQDWHFDVSEQGQRNREQLKRSGNNLPAFAEDSSFLCFGPDQRATTAALYRSYCQWCEANNEAAVGRRSFSTGFAAVAKQKGWRESKTILTSGDRYVRGYVGLSVLRPMSFVDIDCA